MHSLFTKRLIFKMTSTQKVNLLDLAASALTATVAAARPIREYTQDDHNARTKGDGSVLTDADLAAQGAIMQTMQQVCGNYVRIVGEESEEEMLRHSSQDSSNTTEELCQLAKREVYMRFYNIEGIPPLSSEASDGDNGESLPLEHESDEEKEQYIVDANRVSVFVDPLDGTKSYANGDYEYVTILIAIILDNTPCFGVICKPFGIEGASHSILDTGCVAVYGGTLLNGVYIAGGDECHTPSRSEGELPRAIISQSRSEGIVRDFVEELSSLNVIHSEKVLVAGAGEKSLRLVMGTNNEALWFFPKAGTSRWDVAASDALLRQLGGKLTDKFGKDLDYSTSREDAENVDGIIASNDATLHEECIKLFLGRSWEDR